jgi:hypothetical protein
LLHRKRHASHAPAALEQCIRKFAVRGCALPEGMAQALLATDSLK